MHDNDFKRNIENEIDTYINNINTIEFNEFTIDELNSCIKTLKNKLSSGVDKINNLHIKNSSFEFKLLLLDMYNKAVKENTMPIELKNQ